MEILEKYMKGSKVRGLAKEYNTSFYNMEKFIGNTCKKLNIVRETNALVQSQIIEKNMPAGKTAVVSYNDPKMINEKFLALLSTDSDGVLSAAEKTYCVMYAQTGNNKKAVQASGLDVGLKTKEHVQKTVDHAIMLRGFYLRHKPIITKAIDTLQEQNLKDLNISKGYVQINLIQSIEELKEVYKNHFGKD